MVGQGNGVVIEEVDQCWVVQDFVVCGVIGVVVGLQLGNMWCYDGYGWYYQCIVIGQLCLYFGDLVWVGVQYIEQVGGVYVFVVQDV